MSRTAGVEIIRSHPERRRMTAEGLGAATRDLAELGMVWLDSEEDAMRLVAAIEMIGVNVKMSRDASWLGRVVEETSPEGSR